MQLFFEKGRCKNMNSLPVFMTIRETAKTGMISEHHLRLMEKQERLPGVRVGNRFKVNVQQLVEQLNRESLPTASAESGAEGGR